MAPIVFCGVGALGSLAAISCRNLGVPLRFVDSDRVESKNLLSQAYVKASVGKPKAEALKQQMLAFYGLRTEAFNVRLTRLNVRELTAASALLVDAFDNLESRALLSAHARDVGVPLVHGAVSADGTTGLVRWEERFTPDAEPSLGAATCEDGAALPLLSLVAATLARAIQDCVRTGVRADFLVGLDGVRCTFREPPVQTSVASEAETASEPGKP